MANPKAKVKRVNTNPAAIEWPADPYGVTSAFKAGVLEAVRRVAGQADKKEALDAAIAVALEFIDAKYAVEKADLDARVAEEAAKAEAEAEAE